MTRKILPLFALFILNFLAVPASDAKEAVGAMGSHQVCSLASAD